MYKSFFLAFNGLWLCYKMIILKSIHNMVGMQKKSNLNPKFSQEFKNAQHHVFIIDHVQLKNTQKKGNY